MARSPVFLCPCRVARGYVDSKHDHFGFLLRRGGREHEEGRSGQVWVTVA